MRTAIALVSLLLATPALAHWARRCHIEKAERFSDHAPITIDYASA